MQKTPLLITLDYPPQQGGVARYLGNLVQAWGSMVRVIAPQGHMSRVLPEVEEARLFWRGPVAWLPMVGEIWRRRQETSCVLVSHVLPVGTAAWLAWLVARVPYAVLVHGLDVTLARESAWKRWLVARVFASAQSVVANSEAVAKRVHETWSTVHPIVMTPGVEARRFPDRETAREGLGVEVQKRVVVTIGRLISRKGMDTLIQAMRHLPGVELLMVGDGPERASLEKLVAACAPGRVSILGEVSDEVRDQVLAAADVFAFLPRDEVRDIEGFGIVCLEAALAGLPVVATQVGGVGEAFIDQETGLAVPSQDPQAAAEAIHRLFEDPAYAKTLGRAGQERAETAFAWRDRAAAFRALFSKV